MEDISFVIESVVTYFSFSNIGESLVSEERRLWKTYLLLLNQSPRKML